MLEKRVVILTWDVVGGTVAGRESEMAARTHARTQPFYGSMDFVRDNPGEPVPEETFTHSHLSWSSLVPYLLHPSTTIHGILPI